MALPAFGKLTMTMLKDEYAITAPFILTKLYGKPGAPASGKIMFSGFYNKANTFTLNITTSVASPDIHQLALNAGWSGSSPLIVNFNCPYVNSLRLDGSKTFPAGLTINIASGCLVGGVINGGTAIYTRVAVTINNSGTIAGGGGKGGNGQSTYLKYRSDPTFYTGSGGAGGNGQGFANTSATAVTAAQAGANGTKYTYSGDLIGGETNPWAEGGKGGTGGGWGVAGANGGAGSYGGSYSSAGEMGAATSGAVAGAYIDGSSYATWGIIGTRQGRSI